MKEIKEILQRIEKLITLRYKNVLNMNDAVALTGLSKSHLYRLTSQHRIPYYKQGKTIFFDRKEIESWMLKNKFLTIEEINNSITKFKK